MGSGDDMTLPDVLLYDLDGTLVDSNELILSCFAKTYRDHLPDRSFSKQQLIDMMGPPLLETFERFESDPVVLETMIQTYLAHYREDEPKMISIYPGMAEALRYFHDQGVRQYVVTTKFHRSADPSLRHFGLLECFDGIIALEDVKKPKPDPEGILLALSKQPWKRAFMVGDNPTDIEAGKNAGIETIGVSYSYKLRELQAASPDYWIDDGHDLIRLIQRLCAPNE
jgi:pyrophosphatase PpaX